MSKIEWTEKTWNPVTGCTEIAAGCKRCYAREMHRRLRAMGQAKYQHDWHTVTCHHEVLEQPSHWRKPRMVFVNSMSDLFHEDVPESFIRNVFQHMANCRQHTFQVLTKRAGRMRSIMDKWWADGLTLREGHTRRPLPNVWLGASVSSQDDMKRVWPELRETPAAVRFLSCEPLLGPITLLDITRHQLQWVIAGCESGPHRRETADDWIRYLRDQCVAAAVPFFLKQQVGYDNKLVKMPELDGERWVQMPIDPVKGET